MKKNLSTAVIAACFFPLLIFAQATVPSSVEITKATLVTKYEPAFILENGIDNVVRIKVSDPSVNRLLVNASQGTVRQQGEDFIVRPEKPGEISLMIYNYNDLSNPVLIEERKLQVVGSPFVTLAGKQGGKISKEEIASAKKLEYVFPDKTYKITEFKLSIAGKDIEYKEFTGKGEELTSEMLSTLEQAPPGSKFYVEYIRAGNGAGTRLLAPLTFSIAD